MSYKPENVCVVIPGYNVEGTIEELVRKIRGTIKTVIVVDDGSVDETVLRARLAGATVLSHKKNLGKGAALRTGFQYARERNFEAVVTIDGDNQHNPDEIADFLREEADIVIGTRMRNTEGMPLIRFLTNRVTSIIVSFLSRRRLTDSQSGFRLIRTRVFEDVVLTTSNYETESEILIKAGERGYTIKEIPIATIYANQKSNINSVLDTLRFIKLVLGTKKGTKK